MWARITLLELLFSKFSIMDELTDNQFYTEDNKLTPETLRKYHGCEHYSDEEAIDIIQAIEQFSIILFETINKNELKA